VVEKLGIVELVVEWAAVRPTESAHDSTSMYAIKKVMSAAIPSQIVLEQTRVGDSEMKARTSRQRLRRMLRGHGRWDKLQTRKR
jgi:hypothetical protein